MTIRNVVVLDDVHVFDIRPRELFAQYRALLEKDVRAWPQAQLVEVACPGCARSHGDVAFERFGLTYRECPQCLTLYLSPRPTAIALDAYYAQAPSARFWNDVVMQETDQQRREHVVQHRLDWLADVSNEFLREPISLMDWHSKYPAFIEGVKRLQLFAEVQAMASTPHEADQPVSAITAFEAIERAFDADQMVRDAYARVVPGGLLLLTTRTSSGFDLQVLWDRAEHILPPTHLNLLSTEATRQLMERAGFEVLELSTPGQLDVEMVLQTLADAPDVHVSRFLSYVLRHRGADAHQELQQFLQRYQLSSHLRVVGRRPLQAESGGSHGA